MMAIIIGLHVIVCALLIVIILIQRGRGGGLLETFSGVESLFGTKTNALLSRTTSVLAVIFFITCLSLAFLSAQQSRSLLRNIKQAPPANPESVTFTETDQAGTPLPQQEGAAVPEGADASQAQKKDIPQVPESE
ncbi:MAG: preprotein translocase subunit SecG [Candidatus Omnitrophota bacterium]|nr:MAG: preprotein translocase subunit SecG [Candidatus Omnitrophota bacterium]